MCVVAVPRQLWPTLGRRLIRSLRTGDLRTAQRRRHEVVAEFQATIDQARKEAAPTGTVAEEGMRYRRWAAEMPPREDDYAYDGDEMIVDRAEVIEQTHGLDAALRFVAVARGKADPIDLYTEAWLAETGYPPRSCLQHRATLKELTAWCGGIGASADIQAITRKVAGRFASEACKAGGVTRSTVNRKLSTLRTYWTWLERKGHAEENPWLRQTLPITRPADGDAASSRPFTPAEAKALLGGNADLLLADLMRIAALSGARLGAIVNLTVGDCAGNVFDIRRDKTAAGRRRVPTHSALAKIIQRRTEGNERGAWLFPEIRTDKMNERTSLVTKRFKAYRLSVGVDDVREGKRRSLVTFHSWRNWFITEALRAGQPDEVVQQVVGHKPQGVTRRVYFDGYDEKTLRACVEAVKLPSGVPEPSPTEE
jgi:integrase